MTQRRALFLVAVFTSLVLGGCGEPAAPTRVAQSTGTTLTHLRQTVVAQQAIIVRLRRTARPVTPTPAAGSSPAPHVPRVQDVNAAFLQRLNTALKTGHFAALMALYASNATLTSSHQVTQIFSGARLILTWYRTWRARNPGVFWTQDRMNVVAPDVVLSYIHVMGSGGSATKRYVHVLTLRQGKIAQEALVLYSG